jgi:dCTP deaminase
MPLDDKSLTRLIAEPSLSGITYQASALVSELERINDQDFPLQTRLVRDVLLSIAVHIHHELEALYDPAHPLEPKGPSPRSRILSFANLIHELYSFIRYLSASSSHQSPPAVQLALAQLTELHFPKQHGTPVCVVRPQWKYNLKCVPLTPLLKQILPRWVLDPNKILAKKKDELLPALWNKRLTYQKEQGAKILQEALPDQIGVLSFAAVDTPDALYLPLLAHEMGHFIDFSPPKPNHRDTLLVSASEITKEQVKVVVEDVLGKGKAADPGEVGRIWNILCQQIQVCLRELLADLLATRMLGFSFFVAQSKFLKSLTSWSQPKVLDSGYPGIKFRLTTILDHLTNPTYEANPLKFFQGHSEAEPELAKPLLSYIEKWQEYLASLPFGVRRTSKLFSDELAEPLGHLVESVINPSTVSVLVNIAESLIPANKCCSLKKDFFQRVNLIKHDLPPSLSSEPVDAFAEIMSAAWAYQIVYGEDREAARAEEGQRLEEYKKTNRLIFKAIELIPVSQSIRPNSDESVSREDDIESTEAIRTTTKGPDSSIIDSVRKIGNFFKRSDKQGAVAEKCGVLSCDEIQRRAQLPIGNPARISILPLRSDAINGASLDVRLGNWFAYARRTKLRGVRIGNKEQEALLRTVGRAETFVPSDQTFLIHPGDLVLAITQEFIALPNDVMAFVEGKSGLGRLGLFVATATQVAPGFHGVVVLELANAGTVPLELQPETPIAQLVFQVMTDPVPPSMLYKGRYHCQTKPLTY